MDERRVRVLIVDDDRIVGTAMTRMLRRRFDVTFEVDSVAGVERIESGEAFDVIVCDLMMPRLSGMAFHARLAAMNPDQSWRIVFVSGGGFTKDAQLFLQSMKNVGLDKPVTISELEDAILRVAERR